MKIAFRAGPGRVRFVEAGEIYYVEAERHDTLVRTAGRRRLRSTQRLPEWEEALEGGQFVRVHDSYLVNFDRVRELRLRKGDPNDWEVKLDPPVNVILPVSRTGYRRLRQAFGL
jgi:two-component system LytT family response regulator